MKSIIYLILLCVIFFSFPKATNIDTNIDTFINAGDINEPSTTSELNISNIR